MITIKRLFFNKLSVNVRDGSCWVTDGRCREVIHLAEDGTELWRGGGFRGPYSVSANPADGSCWICDDCQVVHLAESGAEICRVEPFEGPNSVSVDPNDGSCWVADAIGSGIIHLAEDGTELWRPDWRDPPFSTPYAVSVNPTDGSCWVSGGGGAAHIAEDGTWLWQGRSFYDPLSISVNPADGSCWVTDTGNGQVVRLLIVPPRFRDVPFLYWAHQSVETCAEAGLISGYPDGTYQPTLPVTRDQMAVFVSRAIADGDAQVPPGPANPSFTDVPTTHWAYRYIEYAKAQRVVQGDPRGLYEPDLPVDRAQMAVFMARALVAPWGDMGLAGYVPPFQPTFADVPLTFWAYRHIEYLADPARGVVHGYPDGLYHPELTVTRDQMAVYVSRAFDLPM